VADNRDAGSTSPAELLKAVAPASAPPGRVLVQDFRPLASSLEWELSSRYWDVEGLRPFVSDRVPHLVNNSGWAAERCADVLFASCAERDDAGSIDVLEIGAGLGLFARLLLDTFRDRCRKRDRDYYERLRYHVTDGSSKTVSQWRASGQFDDHAEHVILGRCDALQPSRIDDGKRESDLPRMRAVFANYVLDNLPAAVIRNSNGCVEQLCARTWLDRRNEQEIRERTGATCEEIAAWAAGADESARAALLRAVPFLELETAFLALEIEDLPFRNEALDDCANSRRTLVSHGAIRCLEGLAGRLTGGGFILVNDVGVVDRDRVDEMIVVSRFGSSIAANVNFPLLERCLVASGHEVIDPAGDDGRTIHSRLVGRGITPAAIEEFRKLFREEPEPGLDRLALRATEHIVGGRHAEALECYRRGLERYPEDWNLLGQAAQFLNQQLLRHEEAARLARSAVRRNPWHSAFLWNTLGNCEFCLGRHDEAHEAFLRARKINPRDPQSHLNLAFSYARTGDCEQALLAVARGLHHDDDGRFESALLEKQKEILRTLASRRAGDTERRRRRDEEISGRR